MTSPDNCIICGARATDDVWNGMGVRVCPHCSLAWRSEFDVSTDYYVDLHTERAGPSEEKNNARWKNALDRLDMIRGQLPRERVCDIGCGDGSFLLALKENGYSSCWGIEPSRHYAAIAREKGLAVEEGGIEDLSGFSAKRSIKAVTMFHLLEHLADPRSSLLALKNALPPGGQLVIETPDSNAAIQRVTNHRNDLVYREHLYYWNERSLRRFLEQHAFRIRLMKRRSFDWKEAPIRASLARLGLLHERAAKASSEERPDEHPHPSAPPSVPEHLLRRLLRSFLARLAHLTKRDDYILIVAEREGDR